MVQGDIVLYTGKFLFISIKFVFSSFFFVYYREDRENSGVIGEGGMSLMLVHFSSSSHSCDRSIRPGIEGALAFNATSTGNFFLAIFFFCFVGLC